jgi:hypothetical protein
MKLATAGGALFGALALAAPAGAASPVSFSCAADAVTAQISSGSVINPITSGGDGKACQPGVTGLPNVGEALNIQDLISAKTAYAAVDPGGAVSATSKPTATAGVEGLQIDLGGPFLGVGAARSAISASCSGGKASYMPTSEVADISLAGMPIVLDGVLQPITDGLTQAVGALVEVKLNEVVDTKDGGKAVRAARITLVRGDVPVANIIVAESRIGLNGAACDPNTDTPTPPNGDTTGTSAQGCPSGAVYDAANKVCVIAVPGSQTPSNPAGQLTGAGSVVVGSPGQGPTGGTVITLAQAKQRFRKSPCVRGGGPLYVVVGTNHKDKITGTNKRDRILGLKRADRLDGGRGRDCIDGGKGRDGMTGGQKNDRVYGRKGRDFLGGDAGNDVLKGGVGNDYINAAYGADRVFGGKGRDKMNVATAGKAAHVHGGSGRDKVRANPGDVPYIHGVEKIIITHKIKG